MIRQTRHFLSHLLPTQKKLELKARYSGAKKWLVHKFRSYDGEKLKNALIRWGVRDTDTLMVHANFNPDSGFQGSPGDLVDAMVELVGTNGNLVMVSIPFRGTSYDHLKKNKPFRVNKTISMMGLATEAFRRKKGVLRSLHPTHPVLAYGRDSQWLVADHEKCLYPCGPGSPFEKVRQAQGKLLFFDVSFGAITFFHYVEDLLKEQLPFNIYADDVFEITVYDQQESPHLVRTFAFNPQLVRNAPMLETEMTTQHLIKKGKVGNSSFLLVETEDVVACHTAMVSAGHYPYIL